MNYGVNGKFSLFTAFKDPLSHTNVLVSYCVLSKRLGLGFPVVNTATKDNLGRRVQ